MAVELPKTCWVVTDGKVGTENACLGLAQILDMTPLPKHLDRKGLNAFLPEALGRYLPSTYLVKDLGPNQAPWPEILITSGRPSVAVSLAIKHLSKNRTFTIHVQDPRLSPSLFDVVLAPHHDHVSGPNVLSLTGTLHQIKPRLCEEAAGFFLQKHTSTVPDLKNKTVMTFLIGGPNSLYNFGHKEAEFLVFDLKKMQAKNPDIFFLMTVSRRTHKDVFTYLQQMCASLPGYLWDNKGANPYMAFLGLADVICVTSDSVAMTSEACSMGKPVYIIELPKKRSRSSKFDTFHSLLQTHNHTRQCTLPLKTYKPTILDESQRVKDFVRQHFQLWSQTTQQS